MGPEVGATGSDTPGRWHQPGERVTTDESGLLQALPADEFDTVEWEAVQGRTELPRQLRCPALLGALHTCADQLLRARVTSTTVTGFDGDRVTCEHARRQGGKGQYPTDAAHAADPGPGHRRVVVQAVVHGLRGASAQPPEPSSPGSSTGTLLRPKGTWTARTSGVPVFGRSCCRGRGWCRHRGRSDRGQHGLWCRGNCPGPNCGGRRLDYGS